MSDRGVEIAPQSKEKGRNERQMEAVHDFNLQT